MDWMEVIKQIFEVLVFPLLGCIGVYVVNLIKKKTDEIKSKVEEEKYHKYIDYLADVVATCCLATTQTYVEALKKEGKFDADAQKIALEKTFNKVMNILSEKSKESLRMVIGDLEGYIYDLIEAEIYASK